MPRSVLPYVRTDALRQQVGIVAAQLAPAAVGDPEAVPRVPLLVRHQAAHPLAHVRRPCSSSVPASGVRRRSPRVLHEQVQAVHDPGYHAQQAGVVLRDTAPLRCSAEAVVPYAARESARGVAARVRARALTSTVSIVNRLLDSLSTAISPGTVASAHAQCACANQL